jgi:hypothetical protein
MLQTCDYAVPCHGTACPDPACMQAATLVQGRATPRTSRCSLTLHSGQLSVERLSQEAQPLLQLGMPWRAPVEQPPAGITAESAVIQVCQNVPSSDAMT